MSETTDKQLNNVQKIKLESFLEKKKNDILSELLHKYQEKKEKISKKLMTNKSKKVNDLFNRIEKIKKEQEMLANEKDEKIKLLRDNGYRINNYSDKLEIELAYDDNKHKELNDIDKLENDKRNEVMKIYENTILKLWTGLQSETAGFIEEMLKKMNKLI